jgi:hypothetical protein
MGNLNVSQAGDGFLFVFRRQCVSFLISVFISHVKILNKYLIGAQVSIKIFDSDPIQIGTVDPKAGGRTTTVFNQGLHLCLRLGRASLPSKLPLIILAQSGRASFTGGVDALDLLQETITKKAPSSIAREHVKVFSDQAKDGGVLTFRIRMAIEKTPVVLTEKGVRGDNLRACDILRRNEQYRQVCRDLSGQVATLRAQVDRLAERAPPPRQAAFQSARTRTTPRTPITFQDQGTRTRPPITLEFESDAGRSRQRGRARTDSDSGAGRRRKRSSDEEDDYGATGGNSYFSDEPDLHLDTSATSSGGGGGPDATVIIEDNESDDAPERRPTVDVESTTEAAEEQPGSDISQSSFLSGDDGTAAEKDRSQNQVSHPSSDASDDIF